MSPQLLALRAAVQHGADAAAHAILDHLCDAAGEPRQGPWLARLERLVVLLSGSRSCDVIVGTPIEDVAEQLGELGDLDAGELGDLDAGELGDLDAGELGEDAGDLSEARPETGSWFVELNERDRERQRNFDERGGPRISAKIGGADAGLHGTEVPGGQEQLGEDLDARENFCPTCGDGGDPECQTCRSWARPPISVEVTGAQADLDERIEATVVAPPVARRWRDPRSGSRTSGVRALLPDVEVGRLLFPNTSHRRPATRGECESFERPCPFVGCRHHLGLDVKATGSIAETWPDREPWESSSTCSLDLAELGGQTLDEIAVVFNVSRERVRQIEKQALIKLRRVAPGLVEFLEGSSG